MDAAGKDKLFVTMDAGMPKCGLSSSWGRRVRVKPCYHVQHHKTDCSISVTETSSNVRLWIKEAGYMDEGRLTVSEACHAT
eukprot:3420660-Prorocentrum_lima.AAC.1